LKKLYFSCQLQLHAFLIEITHLWPQILFGLSKDNCCFTRFLLRVNYVRANNFCSACPVWQQKSCCCWMRCDSSRNFAGGYWLS